MRVLIVGGTRFVGYLLTWRLLAGGHHVTLFNRGTTPDPFGNSVERLRGDRTTPDFARLLAGRSFDAAVDFAAYTSDDVRSAIDTLGGTVGHYVFISTGQVYLVRDNVQLPAREEDYHGPTRPKPKDPDDIPGWEYGMGKREGEDLLSAAWRDDRFPSTRFRIPMVNGERDYLRRVEAYLWRIMDGGPVLLPGGGLHRCRHVYGADVARTIAETLGRPDTFGNAYNLSQDEEPTLLDLLEMLAGMLGAPLHTCDVPREAVIRQGLNPRDVSPFSGRWMSRLDATRAKNELGFRHESVESYMGKIVASILAHPPADRPEGYERRAEELAIAKDVACRQV